VIKRRPCVEQHDLKDCGPACLASISQFYGKRVSLAHLREVTKTDADGTNLYGLIEGAHALGFEAEALGGSFEEMLEGVESGEVALPCIVHTVTEEYLQHFVVVYALSKTHAVIADPAKGKERVRLESLKERWTGHIIALEPSKAFEKGRTSPSLLTFFRELVSQQKGLAASILVCTFLLAFAGIATAFVFQIIIDNILGMAEVLILDELMHRLALVCLATIGLYVFGAFLRVVRGYVLAHFTKRLDVAIVLRCYNHTVDLPFEFFGTRKTGEILARFSDAQTIRDMLSSATFSVVVDGFTVIFGAIIIWMISPQLAVIAFTIAVIYIAIALLYKRRIRRINQMAMENSAQTMAYFKESVDGIETIKALNMEDSARKKTDSLFQRLIATVFKQSVMYNNLGVIIGVISSVGTVLILWLGVQGIFQGVLTLGALITFNALLGYFLTPLGNLIDLQPQLQAAGVAANRLNDILLAEAEDKQTGLCGTDLKGDIIAKDVSFRYGNRDLVLKDVSFTIEQGQKVAIVGESGSGKTTLMKLLLMFYEAESGSILMSGNELSAINKTFLRRRVSYLTQNIFLFSDSIKNNILYGSDADAISEEELERVCKLCRVDEFVMRLPLGLETRLEENGANLSGGQKQRIALARALLRKPDILVLDEAMSNLDSITERALSNMISTFDTSMTCIIIAHRLSTIVQCQKILVMDQGQIIETGTHEELMQKRGKYHSFWESHGE